MEALGVVVAALASRVDTMDDDVAVLHSDVSAALIELEGKATLPEGIDVGLVNRAIGDIVKANPKIAASDSALRDLTIQLYNALRA